MARQPVERVGQSLAEAALDRHDDALVEGMTPIADEGPVGDLVGERVLERVLRLRQHPHFQEQLAGAEPAQGRRDRRRRQLRDGFEERPRNVLADGGGGLQQPLVFGRQPVDARSEHCLYGGRHVEVPGPVGQP